MSNRRTKLLSLQQVLDLAGEETKKLYRTHLNPQLVTMLELVGFDRHFVRAEGTSVWDDSGNEYLDFLGGYGSVNLGHNHPRLWKVLEEIRNRPQILQAALNPFAAALAHNLTALLPPPLQRVFFCNSGAEAVEGALKLARAATGRSALIYCHNSFHGKTFGALSVTGRTKYQEPFHPLLPECYAIPFGDLNALEDMLKTRPAAAFIVEPVQGEGGVNVPPPGYLFTAAALCRRYGTLFILDEIQTGFGRTGYLFTFEEEGVVPDILCLAKSLGGGLAAIGAFVTSDEIWKKAYGSMEKALLHTSTFGGNTLATAIGLATLTVIIEEDLPRQAREKGAFLMEKLQVLKNNYPLIKEVRGKGLLIGLEFNQVPGLAGKLTMGIIDKLAAEYTGTLVASELLNRHHIITAYTLNNPNVIRLEPPLTVSYQQLERVLEALDDICHRHKSFFSLAASGLKTALKSTVRR